MSGTVQRWYSEAHGTYARELKPLLEGRTLEVTTEAQRGDHAYLTTGDVTVGRHGLTSTVLERERVAT